MTSKPYAEVIGDPIDQSLSPAIHGFWLEALGIEASYGRRQITRAELAGLSCANSGPIPTGADPTSPCRSSSTR